jgi:peptide chain release factor subunit 1
MATTVTPNLLRDLAAFRARTGCALSIFIDLDPSTTPTTPDVDAKFRATVNEVEKQAEARADGRDCRLAVRSDIERIRRWWETEFDRDGAHGVAIFASSGDDFFLALPLAQAVPDAAGIAEDLMVAPLCDQFGGDGTLVAVVSREQGRVYRIRNGRLEEIVDETEEQPGQHQQGGWSQGRYQRHIEHLVQQHLKAVGEELGRRARGAGGARMVVICPDEMRSAFATALSQEARDAVIGWTTAEAHANGQELLRVARPILDEADARMHQACLERFLEERGRGERAAAGWQDTLDAAADTRVDVLLVEEGADRAVFQCPDCRRAYVQDGTCPVDGVALVERSDGVDVAIRHVLANNGTVLRFGAGALTDADSIGAVLRF